MGPLAKGVTPVLPLRFASGTIVAGGARGERQLRTTVSVINLVEFHQFIEAVYGADVAKCAGARARPGSQL